MKFLVVSIVLAFLSVSITAFAARQKVIYDEDDRIELSDVSDITIQDLVKSTAAQVQWTKIKKEGAKYKMKFETLYDSMRLCDGQRFAKQNSVSKCTGFLVAKNILVTAGHCMKKVDACKDNAWVFDYNDGNQKSFKSNSVYRCKKVLKVEIDKAKKIDYAVVQLDRKTKNRTPFKFRTEGTVERGASVFIIGFPSGLPVKISGNATVKKNEHENRIYSNLDAFGGNSGSPVINADTFEVEGVLVEGATDYLMKFEREKKPEATDVFDQLGLCYSTNTCTYSEDMSSWRRGEATCKGEGITKITSVGLSNFL